MEEQQKERLLELIKKINKEKKDCLKIVYVDETFWKNTITKRKGVVKDLFFMGIKDTSGRPKCILNIEYDGEVYNIHDYISHTNMSYEVDTDVFQLDGKTLCYTYQAFCNPVKSCQVYSMNGIEKILKGQLMGQNGNSPFQRVHHVVNDGIDHVIKTSNGTNLTAKSSKAELLTRLHPYYLRTMTAYDLSNYAIPKNENEIAIKLAKEDRYTVINKENLETYNNISKYYPIITYEDCKDLLENVPKQEVDFTVIGLGSAGTGVLDQVIRSNYFDKYMFCDFDSVEEKNLRNQWYTRSYINNTKVDSTENICARIKGNHNGVTYIKFYKKFQEIMLQFFKSKYVVSGFDNLECRMELLERCLTDFETRYLIDLRYLDYSSSIYFIDLQDEKQVKYYRNLLQADIDAFEEQKKDKPIKYITTPEEMRSWLSSKEVFTGTCGETSRELFGKDVCMGCSSFSCGSEGCVNVWLDKVLSKDIKLEAIDQEESSCVRENFIDIYKYSSSFVFAAIREIESGNDKPFTHIEAQTEVIPTSVVIRR